MMRRLMVLFLLAAHPAVAEDRFLEDVVSHEETCRSLAPEMRLLLMDARFEEAVAILTDRFPERDRTAAAEYALGHVLFTLAPETSAPLHESAFRKAPDNRLVKLEWAVEMHRLGRFREAETLYAELADAHAPAAVHALRTDCLLHLGRLEDAVASWEAAGPGGPLTGLPEEVRRIYGPEDPERRRVNLLLGVLKNVAGSAEGLILLDLDWDQDRDWWNSRFQLKYLEHDFVEAEKVLGKASARYRHLDFLSKYSPGPDPKVADDPPDLETLKAEAIELGLLGKDAKPAEDSRVAGAILRILLLYKVATPQDLRPLLEKPLLERGRAGDVDALDIVAGFRADAGDGSLEEIDRIGWEKSGEARFAARLLGNRGDAVKPDDALLLKALMKDPFDRNLAVVALGAARRAGRDVAAACARLAMAEFRRMSNVQDTKTAMAGLRDELRKK